MKEKSLSADATKQLLDFKERILSTYTGEDSFPRSIVEQIVEVALWKGVIIGLNEGYRISDSSLELARKRSEERDSKIIQAFLGDTALTEVVE